MRINRVFFDIHMGLSFDGLNAIAKKAKTKIDEDTTVFFLNRKRTAFKLLRGKDYIVYYRRNTRIPLEALTLLPVAFGGTDTEIDGAIRKSLESKIGIV